MTNEPTSLPGAITRHYLKDPLTMNDPIYHSKNELNRREFLKNTSTLALGSAILGPLSIERSAHAAGSDLLKIALVGCGGRGSGAANQALNTQGNVKLVAMADAFKDNVENSYKNIKAEAEKDGHPERVDVPPDRRFVGFEGYKQAIALADVVILATPPGFRPMHFEEAVNAGKHVFMEKPVAVDAPGVRKVLAAAEKANQKNLKVGVGLQRHHQKSYLETVQRLHDGAIGDIVSMRAYWNDAGVWVRARKPDQTEMDYQMRNWYYFNWLCGDHINEQHIHNLDVINWVKNAHPVRAQGMGGRQVRTGIDHGEIFDHHFVEFEYADGSRLFSQCRHIPGCWTSVSEHVQGAKGSADVSGGLIRGEKEWRYQAAKGADGRRADKNPYQQEHDDLFDAIRNNKPYTEAVNGATSTMTSILGRMCTYSGKMIEWDQAIKSEINLMPPLLDWDAKPKVMPDSHGRYPIAIPGKTVAV